MVSSMVSYFNVAVIWDFRYLFAKKGSFNEPLNDWQTLSATNRTGMFQLAKSFKPATGSRSVGRGQVLTECCGRRELQ